MAKTIMFVDGTWLYSNTPRLGEDYGKPDLHIDYSLLPKVLNGLAAEKLRTPDVDLVRNYLFGSVAVNYDLRDDDAVQRRMDFFNLLREEFHYEVDVFPINFRGRRLRKRDRSPNDEFEPKEKCVDIALATALLYYAAIPHVYDIGVVVIGDRDYVPVLQHVRRLGKRIVIASIKGCCAREYSDPVDRARVKDANIIWLNDIIPEIELKYERRQLECQSPLHDGKRKVWTTFKPREGQVFYCDECRKKFAEEKAAAQKELVSSSSSEENGNGEDDMSSGFRSGEVGKLISDKGYGFINSGDGKQYFFHLTDLEGLKWSEVASGNKVFFRVKKEPSKDKAGAAGSVKASTG